MKMKQLTLQIKPVGNNCNLNCSYCYAMPFRADKIKVLHIDTLEKIVKEAFEIAESVIITWHGGEPTMPGVNYYKQYMELVKKYKKPNQTIVNMIQTNATLIKDEFAKFFKENDFIVGISLDGNRETHDKNRYYSKGKGSYDKTMEGVSYLRKQGIYPPVIATVSQSTYKDCEETFNHFIENGFKEIKYSPVYDSSEDSFSISCDEWYKYIRQVLDMWLELGDESIKIREIDEVLTWLLGNNLNICSSSNNCLNWISINEFGEMYPCEYLRVTESYGNINEISIEQALESDGYKRFKNKVMHIPDKCSSCEFWNICHNGCPATRIKNDKLSYDGLYVYCEERQKLYSDILRILETE